MPTNRLIIKKQVAVYASTLFEAAHAAGGPDGVFEVRDQARQVIAAVRQSAELQSVLKDAAYAPEQRSAVLKGVFASLNPALLEVLGVMAERTEADLLPRVWDAYEALIAERLGMCVVEVATTVQLDEHLRELVKKKAEGELGMKVLLEERVDPSLLGGIVMSARGQRIDASVATFAEVARETLKRA
ncbi:ATP synthase F1 subunit delta [Berryella wangjianweii]|uniref:ATP synthase F1 subunit delta n=1 Tax=Berryella wangjianweii TaxID=2734634 RepID=UPI0021BD2312|nr:ATP synthase F1 subunit delta [Berryella wangjianweii]